MSAPQNFSDAALVLLAELVQEVRKINARLDERSKPAPDTGALLLAIHNEIGDIAFNCFDLMERGALSAGLGAAINQRIHNATPKRLGNLFRQIEGTNYSGLCMRRLGVERDGAIWQVCEFPA